jgi:hypothetical protein
LESSAASTATVVAADGDAAHGLTAGQKLTIDTRASDGSGALVDYFVSDTSDGGAAHLAVVANGDTLKSSGTITASLTSGATGIAVGFNVGSSITQHAFLVLLKAAIEHANGHNSNITVSAVPTEADGALTITLTSASIETPADDDATGLTENLATMSVTDWTTTGAGPVGDRYQAHRLFEDTATTDVKRKQSGIEKGTQRPFMFYNGTITVLGQTVGQVVSFTLNGKTGVEQFYTISAANVPDSATDQVPHAGTRNPSLAVEGKTEYDMDMEIIVDDPIFYHNMRRAIRNFDDVITDSEDAELIRLSFNKVASAAGDVESIDILMDDFHITEASLPIPEDKGPLRSTLKILPKTVKVIAKDTVMCP